MTGGTGTGNNAKFTTVDKVDGQTIEVPCHFNPEQFTVGKTNSWSRKEGAGDEGAQFLFSQEGLRSLNNLTLWFDTYEANQDVTTVTDKLRNLMHATVAEPGVTKKRPPHVIFSWGEYKSFTAVIESVSESYKLFLSDGRPARSQVTVSMTEVPPPQAGQNPTSRAFGARRVHVVQLGDTLDWIAHTELGSANAWRALADANGLDDPRRLRPGQRLLIPPTD